MSNENLNTEVTQDEEWLDGPDFNEDQQLDALLEAISTEDSIDVSPAAIVPPDELHSIWSKLYELNALQHVIYNNQLAQEIDALEKLHDNITRLNLATIVLENPEHLAPLVKNNVKIIQARLNTLLEQCITGAEVANLYDIDKPHVKDYGLAGFSKAINTIAKQRIAGLRDIKINTTYDEASDNYLVSFKTDNSDEEKYNTVLQIAGNMLTEVAFDAINSEVISHLGLPAQRDKPAMRVLD